MVKVTIWNDQSFMSKKEKQIRQEKLYAEWKRKRDTREDSKEDTERSNGAITPLSGQQPRVQRTKELPSQPESPSQKAARQRNREQYPEIAAFVDECRRVFGEGVKVVSITPRKDQATPVSDATDD